MPLYRLRSRLRDPEASVFQDLPIEAPTVRHAAARILGRADDMFGDRTGEAWLVAEDGVRVWSLNLDARESDSCRSDAQESGIPEQEGRETARI
ncbi:MULTISPECIES: hypothetical protein [Methylobacterium]|uniref:hypothetical protein n=1 Tax=Methylobacterium TaxID=407 RepID=UPI0013EC8348|nr:hypothetical protein [Methylobacterium sp. DB0501]NGM32529.1 hypothetical protein [Methylobacterium sp. DB0501]